MSLISTTTGSEAWALLDEALTLDELVGVYVRKFLRWVQICVKGKGKGKGWVQIWSVHIIRVEFANIY